jgi:hypothetical protein
MKTEDNKKQEVKELSKEELNTVFGGTGTETEQEQCDGKDNDCENNDPIPGLDVVVQR